MSPALAIARKDLLCLLRDKQGLFWALAFPLVMALFFGAMFGSSGEGRGALQLLVVDEDATPRSRDLVERLGRTSALQVRAATADEARDSVRRGKATAALRIVKGFGEANLFAGGAPSFALLVDPARQAEAGMLEGLLTQAVFEGMAARMADPAAARAEARSAAERLTADQGMNGVQRAMFQAFFAALDRFLADLPQSGVGDGGMPFAGPRIAREALARDGQRPRSTWEITFPQAMLWGVLGLLITFAVSMVREREEGTLLRLRIAPLRMSQILAGKGLAYAVGAGAVVLLILGLAVALFGLRVASVPMLAAALACTVAAFTGLMLLFSTMGRTVPAVSGAASAFMVIASMLGGGMIPLFLMPAWMQALGSVSPVKWAILALEGALWREFDLAEMAAPCAVLLAIGLLSGIAGVRLLRR
ncbi:MAG: ABC transporter permease [Planctomycetes bacterium]|nr:ABC transporter permease [Planctomycetota bacterium]